MRMIKVNDEEEVMLVVGALGAHADQCDREARSRGLTGPRWESHRRNLRQYRDRIRELAVRIAGQAEEGGC